MSTLIFGAISKGSRSLPFLLFFSGEHQPWKTSLYSQSSPPSFPQKPRPKPHSTWHLNISQPTQSQHKPQNVEACMPVIATPPKAMMCWFSKAFNKAKSGNISHQGYKRVFFGYSKWRMIWMIDYPPPGKFNIRYAKNKSYLKGQKPFIQTILYILVSIREISRV